ncbi:MAG: ABC transporter ATP-binding protein [Anaeromicrobium sp.]|jgi:putative ABC transport system ATP-binding protein|uniref:ABC transporter ATP-binding protein n=1 Tax=Anaeromicrobium sp. TaxID=1929132 RepID=UPI0025E72A50|nr:ABC transporter ATP-binding protein [Anaeromicrobium sp.]MCT4594090.1 ABC transporter ATP-binding protein [Anaeromicrobium sp.]
METLRVKNISKIYGGKKKSKEYVALRDVSFEISKGEFLGVMGPSGSGKTTLLNILGSIDRPTGGKLYIGDKDITKLNKKELAYHRMNNIGFIFQDYNLLNTMTLKENILLPLALRDSSVEYMESKLGELCKKIGIENILNKYPYEVSGGEQQRAAACRALITNPKIILADEPTGNLDSKSSKNLLDLISFINKEYETTILMVTHDIYAASYCDKIMFIRDGEIYNELYSNGNKSELFNSIIDVMAIIGGNRYEI